MPRVGFIFKVKTEMLEEYKRRHQEVWPEMQEALRAAGWHNYSLFVNAQGLVVGYFETPIGLADAMAAMNATEVNTRWQEQMAPFMESLNPTRPDHILEVLEEVFHLE